MEVPFPKDTRIPSFVCQPFLSNQGWEKPACICVYEVQICSEGSTPGVAFALLSTETLENSVRGEDVQCIWSLKISRSSDVGVGGNSTQSLVHVHVRTTTVFKVPIELDSQYVKTGKHWFRQTPTSRPPGPPTTSRLPRRSRKRRIRRRRCT
ncbi:uncharacterized protein BCR38DRAFT_179679 [Pseudomassariella vexata]|uniref:Uncharacterized protein n=1 Tax=Pseudomassariella vexata TaxID=1141098 RepID=A0A1Y2E546_9PEZI|nr:uncharacterized protein BCR38DRAFT_179679 [Pseudomassariella vexata]ORY66416.1 hypothetical protein BCR38DRAFT_179679 [Pseudomassariella vexata]